MKETELFEPVKTLLIEELGCSQVYGEISNYDVVGLRGPADVIVEMKTTLNFKVIEQAMYARTSGHYIYIAVPYTKTSHHFVYSEFLDPYGIGLIYVRENHISSEHWNKYYSEDGEYQKYVASIQHQAKFNHLAVKCSLRKVDKKYTLRGQIKEWSHLNVGGSKGGETVTGYSVMIDKVKEYLSNNGWSTIEEILENVPAARNHYANPKASLRATLAEKWNEYWVERKRGENRTYLYNVKEGEK